MKCSDALLKQRSASQLYAVKKSLSQLAVGDGEAFFIPDNAMLIQRQLECVDGLVPTILTSFFQREILVQNAKRPMIVQWGQQSNASR